MRMNGCPGYDKLWAGGQLPSWLKLSPGLVPVARRASYRPPPDVIPAGAALVSFFGRSEVTSALLLFR